MNLDCLRMKSSILICVVILYNCICIVQGANKTIAAVLTATPVYSPGFEYGLDYGPNTTFDYYISTSFPGHNLSLTVVACQIENDKNGACLYDKLLIYDGPNSSSPVLAEFCCANGAGESWISSTNEVYMVFTSDATNEFDGFHINAVSFGPTTTTSTTSTSTTSTTSTTTTTTPTTTSTTTTTTPAPTTTTSTTVPTTTTTGSPPATTASPTTAPSAGKSSGSDDNNNNLYIIIGCVIGGLLLIVLIIVGVCYFTKKATRATTPSSDHKRILWSRQTTAVKPFNEADVPPGTVTQTNIFDMSLPSNGRANLLPPLNSRLEPPTPVVVPGDEKVP